MCPEKRHAWLTSLPKLMSFHVTFLAFLWVHDLTDEKTVRIFQKGSAKDATESSKSEEKEIIIKNNHGSEYE
jgi:hypothetical protein